MLPVEGLCTFCNKEHEPGSPDARDCASEQFAKWASDPDKWEFLPTEEHIRRVREAHVQYVTEYPSGVPDVQAIRMIISNQFSSPSEDGPIIKTRELERFWLGFLSDVPQQYRMGSTVHSIDAAWFERKIYKILIDLKLPYMAWETADVAANLKSPTSLRRAADELDRLEAEGYGLYFFECDKEDSKAEWYFRKGNKVEPAQESVKA